jgi:hypothetical protein
MIKGIILAAILAALLGLGLSAFYYGLNNIDQRGWFDAP